MKWYHFTLPRLRHRPYSRLRRSTEKEGRTKKSARPGKSRQDSDLKSAAREPLASSGNRAGVDPMDSMLGNRTGFATCLPVRFRLPLDLGNPKAAQDANSDHYRGREGDGHRGPRFSPGHLSRVGRKLPEVSQVPREIYFEISLAFAVP